MRRAVLAGALCALLPMLVGADDLVRDATLADAALQRRVHGALVRAFDGDAAGAVADLDALDRDRAALGQRPSGLRDDMRLLAAGLEPDRDRRRDALEQLLDDHPDEVVKHVARHALDTDDAAAADRLLSDDRHNRRANLINDAIRPLGVFSGTVFLAALNPFLLAGSALDSIATTAVNLWNYNRLSPPEREALVRYQTLIQRGGRTEDAPEIVREVQALGRKRAEATCENLLDQGDKALKADDLDAARYWIGRARQQPACGERTAKPERRLAEALAKRAAAAEASTWPTDAVIEPTNRLEALDWEALARATVAGEPGGMITAAQRFTTAHPDSRLAPGAQLVAAMSHDLVGRRPEARAAFERVADDGGGAALIARQILDGPDFGQLDAIRAAERRHGRRVLRYVVLGGTDGRTALYTAAQLGASGAQAAQSLGVVNVLGVATRAWQAWRKDPVSNQEIIDRGEESLARAPEGPEASDVHERLSSAYERAGNHERALMHHRATAAPDPKRTAKLEGKLAKKLLEDAKQSPAAPLLLTAIADNFKETDAGQDARKLLNANPPDDDIALDRDLLRDHPALLGPTALDLDPTLLDGDAANGELGERGVRLGEKQLRLFVRRAGSGIDIEETRPLSETEAARARAAAQEILYTNRLTADERDPEVGRFERYLPVYLAGSLGESGLTVSPGIKTRPYRSPDRQLYE